MRILRPARRFLLLFALSGLVATIAAYGGNANSPDAEHTRPEITAILTRC